MAPTNNVQTLFSVPGLVAVVTGGGSGLGLYAARALDANGAKAVYIVGRREETLEAAAATAINGTIIPIVGDVGDKESLAKVAEQVRSEQGFINLLFANAGVSGPNASNATKKDDGSKPSVQEFADAVLKPEMSDFTATSHINNTGALYTAMTFLPLLNAGNKQKNVPQDSQILITSSIAGFSRALAHGFAYSTSKAAVTHLVKMLSTCFAQLGYHIRVNALAPGLYPSEMTDGQVSKFEKYQTGSEGAFPDAKIMAPDRSPSERTGSEEDLAGTVLFMVSRAGAYLNGETLVTDGGRLSQLPAVY
jgi:NAD(P)-dependent dehydrogenase (short-subunit alcohol dehydrogenase family)